jgi:8-oxo-dGTP diphosphatase
MNLVRSVTRKEAMTSAQVTAGTRHSTGSMVVLDLHARKVLLVAHKIMGKLVFPGGHVDKNEAPDETALREVFEETGLRVELTAQHPITLPGMTWRPQPWMVAEIPAPAGEPPHSHFDYLYIGLADSSSAITAQLDEVDSVGWYPVDDLSGIGTRAEVPALALEAYRVATAHQEGPAS